MAKKSKKITQVRLNKILKDFFEDHGDIGKVFDRLNKESSDKDILDALDAVKDEHYTAMHEVEQGTISALCTELDLEDDEWEDEDEL